MLLRNHVFNLYKELKERSASHDDTGHHRRNGRWGRWGRVPTTFQSGGDRPHHFLIVPYTHISLSKSKKEHSLFTETRKSTNTFWFI